MSNPIEKIEPYPNEHLKQNPNFANDDYSVEPQQVANFNLQEGIAEQTKRHNWRQWLGRTCVGLMIGSAAGQYIPPKFNQPSIGSDIYQLVQGQVINVFAGPQLEQEAAAEAIVNRGQSQFLIENAPALKNIKPGDTFIPEWKLPTGVDPLTYIQTEAGKDYQKMSLSILKFEVEKLGIRQIRLGIRWDNTILPDGQFSLAFYKPYLDFLNSYKDSAGDGVKVLLSVGALKSPGSPESFVPTPQNLDKFANTSLVPTESLPPVGSEIKPKTDPELTKKSLRWLNTLMNHIAKNYRSINYFQLDNEPRNPGGPDQWITGTALEQDQARVVLDHKPNASFLLNWSGAANLAGPIDFHGQLAAIDEGITLFNEFSDHSVINEMLHLRQALLNVVHSKNGQGNIVLGLDSYALTPVIPDLPIQVNYHDQTYTVRMDTTTMIEVAEELSGDNHPWQKLHHLGVPLEITEMQAEPWMPYSRSETAAQIRFMLARQLQVLPVNQSSVIRFWRLSDDIYDLMYDPNQYTDYTNASKQSDPTGNFTFNDKEVLQLAAFLGGKSFIKRDSHDRVHIDNTEIDHAIAKFYSDNPPIHQPVVRASSIAHKIRH
ncbi:MAG: hypothetical protein ACREF5_01120 [Candidatus Saccharimonadales bacterium]